MRTLYGFFRVLAFWLMGTWAMAQTDSIPLFTFGIMTDVQYCDCDNAGTRHYRSSLRKLREAVKVFNQNNVDFVMHLGDFIDHDFQSYDTLNALVSQLESPLFQVLGNHDFSVRPEELKKVPKTLRMKGRYYSMVRARWRFIVLDGNDRSVYGQEKTSEEYELAVRQLEALKAKKAPNAQTWNGGLGEKQLGWLRKELARAAKKKENVLVFCHFPLVPENDPHLLWNAQNVRSLLEEYPNVVAYLNGHVHVSSHLTQKGIQYVTLRGMVELEENGFGIVNVYRDSVKINGFGSEKDRLLRKEN
ncbi:metallophosphoesterase [Larkinella harenae]